MSQRPYKREQGDFELRILKDGRLVMVAPDETLMEIAQAIEASETSEGEAPSTRAGKMPATRRDSEQQHVEIHDAETPTADGE